MTSWIQQHDIAIWGWPSFGPYGSEIQGLGLCSPEIVDRQIKVHLLRKSD
jgi:hypothetical protein